MYSMKPFLKKSEEFDLEKGTIKEEIQTLKHSIKQFKNILKY